MPVCTWVITIGKYKQELEPRDTFIVLFLVINTIHGAPTRRRIFGLFVREQLSRGHESDSERRAVIETAIEPRVLRRPKSDLSSTVEHLSAGLFLL